MLDETDLQNCRIGLLWIQRHRKLGRQAPHPGIARALANIDAALASSPSATEPVAVDDDWLTTTEVAERLGCSDAYVRRIAVKLGGVKHGRDWRYPA
jgi:excisionase family DNA binding protein